MLNQKDRFITSI